MSMKRSMCFLALAAVPAAGVQAQNFSLDFNVATAGSWTGAPSTGFLGAADMPGTWDTLGIGAFASNLTDTNGNTTSADLTVSNLASGYFFDSASTSGDYDRLLGDGLNSNVNTTMTLSFNSLRNGTYTVYTYACSPFGVDSCNVGVTGAAEGLQSVSGGPGSNTLTAGVTHAVHNVVVNGGTLTISVFNAGGTARVGGVQLRYRGATEQRLYVDDTAPGNDGSSWSRAVRRLDDAIAAANFNGTTTEIWVAAGTYRPTAGLDRSASFRMKSNLAIYGGFAGNETRLADRTNIDGNPSFLSGNIGTRDTDDNSYHVVEAESVFSSAILDGFVITGGNADGSGFDAGGGAIWINGANPRIRNCLIRDNRALEGGAVSFFAASSLARFTNCEFRNNETPTFGGAVYFRGANGSQVAFGNCRFIGNSAGTFGGAVYSLNGSGWNQFYNCEFSGNTAGVNGGAILTFGSFNDTRIDNCTFAGNSSGAGGGVVATAGSTVTIDNSIFWGNTDTDAGTTTFEGNMYPLSGTINVNYSAVQGLPSNYIGRGPGCTSRNPLFVDADGADGVVGTTDDDLSLQPDSPCIDAGDNSRITVDFADVDIDNNLGEVTPLDLSRRDRRFDDPATTDIGLGVAPIVDMGAREFRSCPADFNEDGFLDFFDYDDYVTCFETGVCPPGKTADFNGDGFGDFFDYDAFVLAFETGC
jgi:predicted outer membrane repeat protein